MAEPILTVHDSGGTLIPEGTPLVLPTATPGTPTAETVVSVRNNAAAGPAVDTAPDVKIRVLAAAAGSGDEPVASGLAFLDSRALEIQVTAVSGGATAQIVTYRPQGSGRSLSLASIPDGGIATLGLRINPTLVASLTDLDVFLAIESVQSFALPEGIHQAHGNFVYDGRPGGIPDPLFSGVRSITGAFSINGPPDDKVNTPTEVEHTLAGVEYVFEPSPAEIAFTATDGDAASLASGEAYYAAVTLDGTSTPNVTKGPKATAPLVDADKPTPPAGEELALWVVVPFGLAIDTIESVLDLDFFGYTLVSGLGISIGGGQASVGHRWVDTQTATSLTLADDDTTETWRKPESGLEQVLSGSSPTDPQSLKLWEITTASGAVTAVVDHRRIGAHRRGGDLYQASFVVDAASAGTQTVHVQLEDGIGEGIPITAPATVLWYLADDAEGLTPSTVAPTAGTAAGTDGALVAHVAGLSGLAISEADGDLDIVVSDAVPAATFYLVIVVDGRLYVSTVITPTP